MFLRIKQLYKKPEKSMPQEILGHTGELILTVKLTSQLNEELKQGRTLSPKLRNDILDLLNTVQVNV